ncbi:centromere protein scm3 domain-containing protein [Sarocladium implicatum]|nr:centromere protein scm3 domain-containing protein [Sarocladium implicatum]
MESPAKRPRLSKPWESDDDDDLSFQPQEASDRRDPGYQLSVQRAVADNRFMSTMAHIFEKYGRDFEGVGDEIDMMTGEIVVNNGHLKNMRDESDVGTGPRVDGHEPDEDDEGVRLEDLLGEEDLDESEDDEDEDEDEGESAGGAGLNEEEEHRIMQGRTQHVPSMALVSRQSTGTLESAQPPLGLATDPFAGMNPFNPSGMSIDNRHMPFGASPLGFGASPLSFGHSPLAFNPWAQHLPQPGMWDAPEIPSHQAAANRLALQSRPDQRIRSSTSRGTSIWGGGSLYEPRRRAPPPFTRRLTARPGVMMKPRPKKFPQAPQSSSRPSSTLGHQSEDDEDAIMTGRSGRTQQTQATREIRDSDEESLPSPKPREPLRDSINQGNDKSPDQAVSAKGKRRRNTTRQPLKRKFDADDGPQAEPAGASVIIQARTSWAAKLVLNAGRGSQDAADLESNRNHNADADSANHRRSGRERKQVEFLAQLTFPVGGQGKARRRRTGSEEAANHSEQDLSDILDTHVNQNGNPDVSYTNVPTTESGPTVHEKIVPDSQDSLTPTMSSLAAGDTPQEQTPTIAPKEQRDLDSACVLSDDEMPLKVLPSRETQDALPYANHMFRPIQAEVANEPLPEPLPKTKRRGRRQKNVLEREEGQDSPKRENTRGGSTAIQDPRAKTQTSTVYPKKRRSTRPQSTSDSFLDEGEGEEGPEPTEYSTTAGEAPPQSQPSTVDSIDTGRRRSARFAVSEPVGHNLAEITEVAFPGGIRGRKFAHEVRWLMKYNGHESEDGSSDDDGLEAASTSETPLKTAENVETEVTGKTSEGETAQGPQAVNEGLKLQNSTASAVVQTQALVAELPVDEISVRHVEPGGKVIDEVSSTGSPIENTIDQAEEDSTILSKRSTLLETSHQGGASPDASANDHSSEATALDEIRVDTTAAVCGEDIVPDGSTSTNVREDRPGIPNHDEEVIPVVGSGEQLPEYPTKLSEFTPQSEVMVQAHATAQPSDKTLPAELASPPRHASPVVEETDQGEDHSSSAPVRLTSPELGSSIDPGITRLETQICVSDKTHISFKDHETVYATYPTFAEGLPAQNPHSLVTSLRPLPYEQPERQTRG